jgi:SAM-dependent methyltransferase
VGAALHPYLSCAKFFTTSDYAPRLQARLHTEQELAADARARGWEREVERHQCIAERIRCLLTELGEPHTEPGAEPQFSPCRLRTLTPPTAQAGAGSSRPGRSVCFSTPAWQTRGMDDQTDALLAEQLAYYRAHAPDYELAYAGKSWDHCIDELPITGDVLELACGTGYWTRMLAARARSVTAVDAAPEALALARQRVSQDTPVAVEFVQADLFDWRPPRRYDTVFFAFWLTHVPPARLAAFWSLVASALTPGGQACFLDDSIHQREHERVQPGRAVPTVWRPLRDGSDHSVVKVFYEPADLAAKLAGLGWSASIREASVGGWTPLLVGTAWPSGSGP